MKPAELILNDDCDNYVWVWDNLQEGWLKVLDYAAYSFFKTWPDRFLSWLPLEKIKEGGE